MADAQDLKSWDRKTSCEFESNHRHQPSPSAQRVAKAVVPKLGAKADFPSNDSAASVRQASEPIPKFLVLPFRREYFAGNTVQWEIFYKRLTTV